MSVAQHRDEARREQVIADREAALYQPAGPGAPPHDPAGHDPNEAHRQEAEIRREHARQHASAADFLEQFEGRACADVARETRASCPFLGPLVALVDIDRGVRATFANPKRVQAAIAEMRCHYAYARARHFDAAIGCPLYVRGIEIRQGLDPRWIEIVGRDEPTVRTIRARAREQAVFARSTRSLTR